MSTSLRRSTDKIPRLLNIKEGLNLRFGCLEAEWMRLCVYSVYKGIGLGGVAGRSGCFSLHYILVYNLCIHLIYFMPCLLLPRGPTSSAILAIILSPHIEVFSAEVQIGYSTTGCSTSFTAGICYLLSERLEEHPSLSSPS